MLASADVMLTARDFRSGLAPFHPSYKAPGRFRECARNEDARQVRWTCHHTQLDRTENPVAALAAYAKAFLALSLALII
jgi:hypothetical protein